MIFDIIWLLYFVLCVLYVGMVKCENIGFDIIVMIIEEGEIYDKVK